MAKRKRGSRSSGSKTVANEKECGNSKQKGCSKSEKRHLRKMQRVDSDENGAKESLVQTETSNISKFKKKAGLQRDGSSNPSTNRLDLGKNSIRPKSALQEAFLARLAGSRFRELNEELYTTNSSSAFERFQKNPDLFDQYHEGFREQVKSWPVNPVDAVYRWILSVNRKRPNAGSTLTIADFGCGDAKLAEKLLKIRAEGSGKSKSKTGQKKTNSCPFTVHSFDLVANGNPHITPCDMAAVPLKKGTVDVAVFVLALMGTNIADFIREAHRVLNKNGILKIAEVRSRFEAASTDEESSSGTGKKSGVNGGRNTFKYSKKKSDDSLFNEFIQVMNQLGFHCKQKDRSNKMFILLEFEKTGKLPSKDASFTAKPCIYKRR